MRVAIPLARYLHLPREQPRALKSRHYGRRVKQPPEEYFPHKLHVQRWLHGPRGRPVRAGGELERLNASGLCFDID